MSKCESGVDVKCPFYRKNGAITLTCEGIIPDTRMQHAFWNAAERDKHMNIFCNKAFTNCEAYRAILEKYEEDEP